jgi:hypothetical protein
VVLSDAESASGSSLVGANPGQVKRLIAGTSITLDTATTPGGVIINSTAAGSGGGDMLKSVYDTNANNIVDTCDALAWTKLTGVPATFPPDATAEKIANKNIVSGYAGLDANTKISTAQIRFDASLQNASNNLSVVLTDAEATTGVTLVGANPGQVKRLVAGSNVTLDTATTPGAVTINSTAGGGSGGGLLDRTTGIELFDDFVGNIPGGVSNGLPSLGWFLVQDSGSGASLAPASIVQTSPNVPEIGVWNFSSQTTGGLARLSLGLAGAGQTISATADGQVIIEWRIKSAGGFASGQYAEFRFGVNGGNTSQTYWTNLVCFLYNFSISANWQCYGFNGTNYTVADSGIAVSTTVYQRLTVTINATWTQAVFAIGGTTVNTMTIAPAGAGSGWSPIATVGGAVGAGAPYIMRMDWMYCKYLSSRS